MHFIGCGSTLFVDKRPKCQMHMTLGSTFTCLGYILELTKQSFLQLIQWLISLKLQLEIGSNRPVATLLLKLHLKKILVHISIHIISYYWLTYLSTFLGMRYILSLAVDPGGGPWARGPPPVPFILSSGNFLINNGKKGRTNFLQNICSSQFSSSKTNRSLIANFLITHCQVRCLYQLASLTVFCSPLQPVTEKGAGLA